MNPLPALACTLVFGAGPKIPPPPASLTPARAESVQLAVEKGLFFIEYQSMKWWKTRKSLTCHEGHALLLANNVAKRQGIPIDQAKLDFWTERWIFVDALALNKKGKRNGVGELGLPLLLYFRDLGRDASPERAKAWGEILRTSFASQQKEGDWSPREPLDITPWMPLALASLEESKLALDPAIRKELTQRRIKTEEWIRSQQPPSPDKTEALSGWVAYEHKRGTAARAKVLLAELLNRQHADGGWGMKKADPSHLLVTGMSLFTLKLVGLPNDHPAVARAQKFLLGKQSEDGRWREKGRHFEPDKFHTAYDAWTTGTSAGHKTPLHARSGARRGGRALDHHCRKGLYRATHHGGSPVRPSTQERLASGPC
jgi:hypothetical protein